MTEITLPFLSFHVHFFLFRVVANHTARTRSHNKYKYIHHTPICIAPMLLFSDCLLLYNSNIYTWIERKELCIKIELCGLYTHTNTCPYRESFIIFLFIHVIRILSITACVCSCILFCVLTPVRLFCAFNKTELRNKRAKIKAILFTGRCYDAYYCSLWYFQAFCCFVNEKGFRCNFW